MDPIKLHFVRCRSGDVNTLIEALKIELLNKMPIGSVRLQIAYKSLDEVHHTQYDSFELAKFPNGKGNPNFLVTYNSDRKLRIRAEATYRRVTSRHKGFLTGDVTIHDRIRKNCDLVWVEQIPRDFDFFGFDRSVLVTADEYRQLSESLSEGTICRDLGAEDDRKLLAEIELRSRSLEY